MSDPEEGTLSETVRLDPEEAGTPISDADAVAGNPPGESGAPDDGLETGPNAKTGNERTGGPDPDGQNASSAR